MNRTVLRGVVALLVVVGGAGNQLYANPFTDITMDGTLIPRDADRLEVDLPGRPVHIAVRRPDAVEVVAVLHNGRRISIEAGDRRARITSEDPGIGRVPTYIPPIPQSWYAGNQLTAPALLPDGGLLSVSTAGHLQWAPAPPSVAAAPEFRRVSLDEDLLPDARIVPLDDTRWIALAGPTDEYPHGIMGDRFEAAGFAVIEFVGDGTPPRATYAPLQTSGVMETVLPIVADIVPGGEPEILMPVSTAFGGSRLVAAAPDGTIVAEGPPIGLGNRWRHVLGVGRTGPTGETEIVVVRTPHIGGVLEYYRIENNRLRIVHSRSGYSTHRIGDRTLQTAVIGDFGGTGGVQVMIPTQDQRSLAVITRTPAGSEAQELIALPGRLSTNIATDRGTIAVGTDDGTVLILHGR